MKDGSMARLPDLAAYAQLHRLKIGAIADLIAYRRRTEPQVVRVLETVGRGHGAVRFQRQLRRPRSARRVGGPLLTLHKERSPGALRSQAAS
jgi:hypothetical protein